MKAVTVQKEMAGNREAPRRALYFAAAVGIAVLSYALLMRDIRLSLWPHAQFFKFAYGMPFEFVPGVGYVSTQAGFSITEGCMGVRLFVSAFLLATLGFSPRGGMGVKAAFLAKAFALSLAGAFVISLLRISISLPFLHHKDAQLIHNIISLAVYFGCMAALFFLLQKRRDTAQREDDTQNE
ncbi:MAG TPA: exosortase K [Clostridiales bacterium]|nr:exosortase K [Clostridiales bacterium]